ncbi:aminodeoxychorismate synthase component I [Nocardia stercoris]|uniref:aminodeoxychorismate synthase component I n=1 Tax=Nocardia stercoris TaxID=2483361 RepID=UPI002278E1F1|nr:aminodeoxychorismate synthase component I [Nocardia stercoris]
MTRILIVDNYDSFTFNLVQMMSEVAGVTVVVVPNDADIDAVDLDSFDGVVLSPGPGNPTRAADFGICATVLERFGGPVLGVCLGHQGIGVAYGGTLVRAEHPMHGRTSVVRHDSDVLFDGVPQEFSVVRYHSLILTELGPRLRAIAWTDAGEIMGLRHTERPLWGVQFHPESILTEYGARIAANFCALAANPERISQGGNASQIAPEPAPPTGYQLAYESFDTAVPSEELFELLFAGRNPAFWLDTSLPGRDGARFGIMGGCDPDTGEWFSYDVDSAVLRHRRGGVVTDRPVPDFFEFLRAETAARAVAPCPELPFDFALGYVGYLGYEMKAQSAGSPNPAAAETPDAAYIFADRAVVVDETAGAVYLLALVSDTDPAYSAERAEEWFARTRHAVAELAARTGTTPMSGGRSELLTRPVDSARIEEHFEFRHDRGEYLALIRRCQDYIRAGESYEICLTNTATARRSVDPLTTYLRLRELSPVPYAAYLTFGEVAVLSASPESFLRVTPDGVVESSPIKGTRPRGRTAAADARLRADLAASEKDRAENLMIVDLLRNDLGRVCRIGSVRVTELFTIETYAPVHQLVSTIRGELAPGVGAIDCARAAFPGGSMTGAPKLRTTALIGELEGAARGVYSGALGWFSLSGAAQLSIVIRTVVVTGDRVSFGVGGAITLLSDPVEEYQETLVKARAMATALLEPAPPARLVTTSASVPATAGG